MTTRVADILCFVFIATATSVAVYLYPSLPEQIPTHWNVDGEVDDFTAKPWGVIVMPAIAALSWAFMKLIQIVSPRGFRTDTFKGVVNVFQVVLVAFLSIVAVSVLLEAIGVDTHINNAVVLGTGLMFVVLGNYMGKVRKNFFIGIRTPWTLASDEVWARTHRLGGWLFVAGGIIVVIGAFTGMTVGWMATVIIAAALVPVAYSFVVYQRVEGFHDDADDG